MGGGRDLPPTPLDEHREPDLHSRSGDEGRRPAPATRSASRAGEHYYPGTTREVLLPIFEARDVA